MKTSATLKPTLPRQRWRSHRFYFITNGTLSVLTNPEFIGFWAFQRRRFEKENFVVVLEARRAATASPMKPPSHHHARSAPSASPPDGEAACEVLQASPSSFSRAPGPMVPATDDLSQKNDHPSSCGGPRDSCSKSPFVPASRIAWIWGWQSLMMGSVSRRVRICWSRGVRLGASSLARQAI